MKKNWQIDRLLGFLVTLVVPAVVAFKIGESILRDSTERQIAINVFVVQALAVFVIVRLASLAGVFRHKS